MIQSKAFKLTHCDTFGLILVFNRKHYQRFLQSMALRTIAFIGIITNCIGKTGELRVHVFVIERNFPH